MADWEEHDRYAHKEQAASVAIRLGIEMPNYKTRVREINAHNSRRPFVVEFRKVRYG